MRKAVKVRSNSWYREIHIYIMHIHILQLLFCYQTCESDIQQYTINTSKAVIHILNYNQNLPDETEQVYEVSLGLLSHSWNILNRTML